MSFYEWWVEEFDHPPLPEEVDLYARCRKAYERGWEDARLLERRKEEIESGPKE